MEEIDSELFHKSPKLEHLVIDHNKLTVPLVEWQKYGNNVHLSLAENPWHCDCPMLIFINSILNEGWFPTKFFQHVGTILKDTLGQFSLVLKIVRFLGSLLRLYQCGSLV